MHAITASETVYSAGIQYRGISHARRTALIIEQSKVRLHDHAQHYPISLWLTIIQDVSSEPAPLLISLRRGDTHQLLRCSRMDRVQGSSYRLAFYGPAELRSSEAKYAFPLYRPALPRALDVPCLWSMYPCVFIGARVCVCISLSALSPRTGRDGWSRRIG